MKTFNENITKISKNQSANKNKLNKLTLNLLRATPIQTITNGFSADRIN